MTPTPSHRLSRRLAARLDRWGVDGPIVVAVSGGSDSVALLRLLHEASAGRSLIVAHMDHGLRGDASDADAKFVAELARSLGLAFHLHQWKPAREGRFEAEARRARYLFLLGLATACKARYVAVGHTHDDQAETILHRVLRGTGVPGLAGMPARRRMGAKSDVRLIRPLLGNTRRELRSYLEGLGQTWREDATNEDPRYTRARLRHDLLPKLATEYNPRVRDALVRLGHLAAADRRLIGRRLRGLLKRVTVADDSPPGSLSMDLDRLRRLKRSDLAGVLRLAWRRKGWPEQGMDARRWRRLARFAADGTNRLDVHAQVSAVITPERRLMLVELRDHEVMTTPGEVELPVPGSVVWRGWRLEARELEMGADGDPRTPPGRERIDLDTLAPPLTVDEPATGERFDPLGMDGHTQALADFLRGRAVPRGLRNRVPVVRDALGIVWVAGHRIAHRVRRTENTTRELELTVALLVASGGHAWEPRP